MIKRVSELPQHPARALLPPLGVMESLGFSPQACLACTGIALSDLEDTGARISLQQELRFYRNTLELTGNPMIGLQLGEPFVPQRYGLFGYALLSAETFRHALAITENFGRLTFSFFSFRFGVEGQRAWFAMCEPPALDEELLRLYVDRDMSAAVVDFEEILGSPLGLQKVLLPHDGAPRPDAYREHFGCDVEFGADDARLYFSSAILDQPLPQSDPESTRHLQQQCQMLIAKLKSHSNFVDEVRMLILERPAYFPDIDFIAQKMAMSTRTLRRRLKEQGSSYRELLDEVRFGLAREYLSTTELPMDEISRLVGYSEPGSFSHAFRRWSGESPSAWRQSHLAELVT
jgi:AraC-like DNA-binding protein